MFRSTNNGASWDPVNTGLPVNPNGGRILSLAVSGTELFAGTWWGEVFLSTDSGDSWTDVGTGLYALYINALAVNGTNLFAGTGGNAVWRRPLSEMITSVESVSSEPPLTFSLEQNYPNPFNHSTTISFNLAKSDFVTLSIYDLLGREIENLVNGQRPVGEYEVNWNTKDLPSGIYLCRLQAGDFVETRKLILQR